MKSYVDLIQLSSKKINDLVSLDLISLALF